VICLSVMAAGYELGAALGHEARLFLSVSDVKARCGSRTDGSMGPDTQLRKRRWSAGDVANLLQTSDSQLVCRSFRAVQTRVGQSTCSNSPPTRMEEIHQLFSWEAFMC
jgi:hypothetical protein